MLRREIESYSGYSNVRFRPEADIASGIDKLTRGRGLALSDGDCSVVYVDTIAHSERVLKSEDA